MFTLGGVKYLKLNLPKGEHSKWHSICCAVAANDDADVMGG